MILQVAFACCGKKIIGKEEKVRNIVEELIEQKFLLLKQPKSELCQVFDQYYNKINYSLFSFIANSGIKLNILKLLCHSVNVNYLLHKFQKGIGN